MSRLTDAIDHLRRRLRRGIVVHGLLWTLVVCLTGLTLAAGIDALVGIENQWVRFSLLLVTLAAGLATSWLQLAKPLLGPWDDVTIALLIERLHPQTRDRVATAAALTAGGEPLPGAPFVAALQTDAERAIMGPVAPQLTWRRVLTGGVSALALTLLVLSGWFAALPAQAVLALNRQLRPFAAADWPRATWLVLLNERLQPFEASAPRYAADEPVTVYVTNRRGDLPSDLRVELRPEAGPVERLEWTPTQLRNERGQEQSFAVATLTPRAGTFEIRASGGDDDTMSWRVCEAVPAPRLDRFTIRSLPPPYTGLAETHEERTTAHVEGVVGTRFELTGYANVPLADVALHREGASPQALTLGEDSQVFTAALNIDAEGRGTYWFEFTDRHGLPASRPTVYELRGRRDLPPEVQWLGPPVELTVTSRALVPLNVEASDDFGLGTVELHSTGSDAAIWSRTLESTASGAVVTSNRYALEWDLSSHAHSPGERIQYSVSATDRREPDPQTTVSATQSFLVVSDEQKLQEIAGHQAGMAQLLTRVRSNHQQASEALAQIDTQWTVAESLRADDAELLHEIEQRSRRTLSDLANEQSGLAAQIQHVRRELRWNRLDDPSTSERLSRLEGHWQTLVGQLLPDLGRQLGALHRELASTPGNESTSDARVVPRQPDEFSVTLRAADDRQSEVTQTLAAMLTELDAWRQRSDTGRLLDELLASQLQVQADTQQIGQSTLARTLDDLDPQQRADLLRLADRQRGLAETVQQAVGEATAPATPQAAGVDVTPELADGRLSGLMQTAADFLAANQIGEAQRQQAQVIESLHAAIEELRSSGQADLDSQLETLRKSRVQATNVRQKQEELRGRAERLRAPSSDAVNQEQLEVLRKEQGDISAALKTIADELRRQMLSSPATTAERAASRSRDAAEALELSRPERIAAAQQDVLDDLTRLNEELDREVNRIEERRVAQLLLMITDALPPLRDQTLELADRTAALESLRQSQGRFSRAELKQLQEVAQSQQSLHTEIRRLTEAAAALELVHLQLQSIARRLQEAAERLGARQTDVPTTALQREAATHMQILVDSLQRLPGAKTEGLAGPAGNKTNNPAAAAVNWLEISLLRNLQANLVERTADLEQRTSGRQPTAEEQAAWDRLAAEQSDLGQQAELIFRRLNDQSSSAENP